MGKHCSLTFSYFVLLIAFKPAFAARIEAVIEKDKSLIRKSSASRAAPLYLLHHEYDGRVGPKESIFFATASTRPASMESHSASRSKCSLSLRLAVAIA